MHHYFQAYLKAFGIFIMIAYSTLFPRNHFAEWYHGQFKLLACKNQGSWDRLKLVIEEFVKLWQELQFLVIPKDRNPHKTTLWSMLCGKLFKKLFTAFLFIHRVFARNLLKGSRRRNIFFRFVRVVCAGVWSTHLIIR